MTILLESFATQASEHFGALHLWEFYLALTDAS